MVAKLASEVKTPHGAPRVRHWYVERKSHITKACDLLGIGKSGDNSQVPQVVGLTGPSGAGKSTFASMVIDQEDVRAHFHKGVLWLQVGQGGKDRLPELKSRLANMVYETVMQKVCRAPEDHENLGSDAEDGVEYIKEVMSESSESRVRFLVVADDVWDVEVLNALKSAGAWVLYTSRRKDLLPKFPQPLWLDQVLKEEAELVLRRAADLDDDAILPEAAYELMKQCKFAVLDLAFVGRWRQVCYRSGDDGQASWKAVLDRIMEAQKVGKDGQSLSWRAAVLRVGLDQLDRDNPNNKELYLSLAVIPKGLAFPSEVAAVLLYGSGFSDGDLEVAEGAVVSLERWSILRLEDGDQYRVHAEHADFIHELGTANSDIRETVLPRWREYMSTAPALFAFSEDRLMEIWACLARAEGVSVIPEPYDVALKEMDPSDTNKLGEALRKAAEFHGRRREYTKMYSKSIRFWKILKDKQGVGHPGMVWILNALGVCAGKKGKLEEAEQWFRLALEKWEDEQRIDYPNMTWTLSALDWHAGREGRTEEAEKLLRRALEAIEEGKLAVDHPDQDKILNNLGLCASKASRTEAAQDPYLARTLIGLGVYAGNTGRTDEAEKLHQRARIQGDKLGIDHPDVADTLHDLGFFAHRARRMEEAEKLYRRALAIHKDNHPHVANTLYCLGVCVGKAGKKEEAEELFRRALAIRNGIPGIEHRDVSVGDIIHSLAVCVDKGGRRQDAEDLYRQALAIREYQLGKHPAVASTLYNLALCVLSKQRAKEAEGIYRDALKAWPLSTNHVNVAHTP